MVIKPLITLKIITDKFIPKKLRLTTKNLTLPHLLMANPLLSVNKCPHTPNRLIPNLPLMDNIPRKN